MKICVNNLFLMCTIRIPCGACVQYILLLLDVTFFFQVEFDNFLPSFLFVFQFVFGYCHNSLRVFVLFIDLPLLDIQAQFLGLAK